MQSAGILAETIIKSDTHGKIALLAWLTMVCLQEGGIEVM
jgi:hypothetical protein